MADLLDIKTATHKELLTEYEECEKSWGKYSCDCLGFYIQALHTRIVELGGWPIRKKLKLW